jgi:hypothetical protein
MRESKLCVVAGVSAATLYLTTLSRWYSADSLWFAVALDSANPEEFIRPKHLLLHPLCWLWVELWRALGWSGFSIHPLQTLNALAGALCVALVCSIATRASGSRAAAALVAAGCAVSGGLWLLSTEAEDVTLGMVAHLAAARWILGLPSGGNARAWPSWALGAAIGAAALAYASNALLLGVAVLAHWQGRHTRPTWLRSLAWMCAGFVCLAAPIPYIALGIGVSHADRSLLAWHFFGEQHYGSISLSTLPRGLYAFLRMLVLYPGIGINDRTTQFLARAAATQRTTFAVLYVVAAAVIVLPLVAAWRQRHIASPSFHRLLLWAALFGAFAFWWVPSDLEFWLPVALAWWIVLALVIAHDRARQYGVAMLTAGLLLANGFGLILPHRDATRNEPLQIALRLDREINQDDRIIARASVHLFLRYFGGRDSVRVETRQQLEAAVDALHQGPTPATARLFVAGLDLDGGQRNRWHARPVFEDLDAVVWQLE